MKTKIAIISGIIFAAILFTGITSSFMFPGLTCPAGTIVKNDVCVITSSECDEGFKNIDGICKQLGKIREKDIGVFFEIQLMELGIEWELADRSWANPDFEIEPPARICSQIIKDSGAELYISTIWQDEYSLSDMIIQEDMPDDCVKFFPVTQVGRK